MVFILVLSPHHISGQDSDVDKKKLISDVAKKELVDMVKLIPFGREKNYGFTGKDEFKLATLGEPMLVYTFADSFFNNSSFNEKESLVSTRQWRFPVIVDGDFRALLTVANCDGKWKAVDFGATVLAQELGSFETDEGKSQNKMLLRCYQKKCDFIVTRERSGTISGGKIFPLHSARLLISRKTETVKDFYTLKEIRELLGVKRGKLN